MKQYVPANHIFNGFFHRVMVEQVNIFIRMIAEREQEKISWFLIMFVLIDPFLKVLVIKYFGFKNLF